MKTKRYILLIVMCVIYGGLIFGIEGHTPGDHYVFRSEIVDEFVDVNYPIILVDDYEIDPFDPNKGYGGDSAGNFLIVIVDLPPGLSMTEPTIYPYNHPKVTVLSEKVVPGPNDLCLVFNIHGQLAAGQYDIEFVAEDAKGNRETAYFMIDSRKYDDKPPMFFSCRGRP